MPLFFFFIRHDDLYYVHNANEYRYHDEYSIIHESSD